MTDASARQSDRAFRVGRLASYISQTAGRLRGSEIWDRLALAVVLALVALVILTFRDYGITTDEYVQQVYGEKLWAFYLSGFTDRSAFHFENLHLYGGLFDMLAVALQHVCPIGIYETRHLLCGVLGVGGVVGTWRLARLLAGPRAGFLGAALLAATASWYGATFNNTKDIPFAVAMVWALYVSCLILTRLPRPPLRDVLAFGFFVGSALGTRFGGVLAVLYLVVAVVGFLVVECRLRGWRAAVGHSRRLTLALLPAVPVACTMTAFFWPWSVISPPNALHALAELTEWPFRTELGGTFYRADALPWTYLPSYLAIKLPEISLLGIASAIAFSARYAGRRWSPAELVPRLPAVTTALAVAAPIVYVLVARPAIYNGMRHFFFLLPPLCALAAIGLDRLWLGLERRHEWFGIAFSLLLLGAAGRELATMVDLHPNEYVYFNAFVGGPRGAYRRYELDYWSNFLPEAIQKLDRRIRVEYDGRCPPRNFTVGVCTAPRALDNIDIPYLKITQDWKVADFIIPTTNTDCDRYADGRTIITIERDGAVLGVVKDRRLGTIAEGSARPTRIR